VTVPILLGFDWRCEPAEQPADRTSLQQYDVSQDVLAEWRKARSAYVLAKARLLREIERQGFRATPRPRAGGYVDVVFDGPPDHEPPRFVEVEDEWGRSIRVGEWIRRPDEHWALRIPLERPSS
jgi:hypothetical protein